MLRVNRTQLGFLPEMNLKGIKKIFKVEIAMLNSKCLKITLKVNKFC
jgi:hypothetical protein